ncbi:MAG: hypothetical protein KIT14_21990 [bacterium]|nr:hypothetical protein [bacterium]
MRLALAAALLCLTTGRALAVVLGGGLVDADCRIAFGDVDATAGASGVVCTDGDPTCDRDGVADGQCRFTVRLCTGVDAPTCDPATLSSVTVAGLALPEPPLPSQDGACGEAADVVVPVGTASGATVLARGNGALRDVDYLNLCCRSGAGLFDAARCALAVDLAVSGCTVPRRVRRLFAAADRLVASGEPTKRAVRRARRSLFKVRQKARRMAARDACGNALGLVASHAEAMLAAAAATNLTR